MAWQLTSDRPIYNQIIEKVTLDIVSGVYSPGEKLPSVRDFASEAGVNPNTMQKALAELERNGLVASMRTSGRFITEDNTLIQQEKERLATETVSAFVEQMKRIGMEATQVIDMVANNFQKQEENV